MYAGVAHHLNNNKTMAPFSHPATSFLIKHSLKVRRRALAAASRARPRPAPSIYARSTP